MGGFAIVEDRPTPKEVYNWRIYTFAAVASAGALVFGYDGAFFGTTYARASFKHDFGITKMSKAEQTTVSANLTSCFLAAAFFGALAAWPTMEFFGRRVAIRFASFVFVVGAIVMTVPKHNLDFIYAGRAITGFAAGALTAVIPTFIAETSPPAIRGQLTGCFEISYQAGALVGFWINYGINQHINVNSSTSWRLPMAVQLIPGGLLFLGSFLLRESPFHLFRKGQEERAIANLTYLRNLPADHVYILEEISMARAKLEDELAMAGGKTGVKGYLSGAFKELLTVKDMRHRVIVTFAMFTTQNWSGAACINYYSPTLFASLGVSDVALYTGIYGLVKAIGSFIFFLWIIDRSGRRKPWLISAAACAGCLLYLAIYSHSILGHKGAFTSSQTKGGNAAIAFVMIYSLFWSFGGNGLPWIVSSEMFPIRVRSLTGAYGACIQWAMQYAATEAFPHMVASPMGIWGTFLFYSLCCIATCIIVFIWIPETKAIPIEGMNVLFGGPVRHAAWRQKKVYPPDGMPPLPERLAQDIENIHGKEGGKDADERLEVA